MAGDLTGRTALVTGSTRGIGRAIAAAFAARGADLVIHGREPSEHARILEEELSRTGRRIAFVAADFAEPAAAERLVREGEQALGPIDILVNNAAIARPLAIEALTRAEWDAHVAVNLTSVFLATQAVLPAMRARRFGRVIFLSSTAVNNGGTIGPHYVATKAGLLGLMRGYASRLAQEGITFNAISPGLIETDMIAGNPRARADLLPVGRFGRPQEVAEVAVLLAVNGYMTGQNIQVNGGWYMA